MAGTILVYVYAALFLPCSLRVALFFFVLSFSGFIFFGFLGWFFFSLFSPCVISFSGFLLCFCSGSASPFLFFLLLLLGFLLPFIEIPKLPPLTSPVFAGLLFATNEIMGERRDPRLDRIRCRFSAC